MHSLDNWEFVSWLLVMGFLTKTPYPIPGDLIFMPEEHRLKYYGILSKEDLENTSFSFFYGVSEKKIEELERRYRELTK